MMYGQQKQIQSGMTEEEEKQIIQSFKGINTARLTPSDVPDKNEKYTTIFINKIPTTLDDIILEQILLICGRLKSWTRVLDHASSPLSFGFAVFSDSESTLKAIRLLNGIYFPMTLPEDGGGLKLVIGESTRKHLDIFKRTQPRPDPKLDQIAMTHIKTIIDHIPLPLPPSEESPAADTATTDATTPESQTDATSNSKSKTEKMDVDKPLPTFHELERRQRKELAYRRRKDEERERDQYVMKNRKRGNKAIDATVPVMEKRKSSTRDEDDAEEEKKRLERRKKEIIDAFQDRVKRWEKEEYYMLRKIKKEEEAKLEYTQAVEKARERNQKRYAEFDDDVEMELGKEEYYRDRKRYFDKRNQILKRELANDEQDAIQEKREEQLRIQEHERYLARKAAEAEKIAQAEAQAAAEAAERERQAQIEREKRKRLVDDSVHVGRIITTKERDAQIKKIVADIPVAKIDLSNYALKWDNLSLDILRDKIRPFVAKKTVEYFGVEDDEVVEHVLGFIREREGFTVVEEGMKDMLENDTEMFVVKLWRLLIFETERIDQGL